VGGWVCGVACVLGGLAAPSAPALGPMLMGFRSGRRDVEWFRREDSRRRRGRESRICRNVPTPCRPRQYTAAGSGVVGVGCARRHVGCGCAVDGIGAVMDRQAGMPPAVALEFPIGRQVEEQLLGRGAVGRRSGGEWPVEDWAIRAKVRKGQVRSARLVDLRGVGRVWPISGWTILSHSFNGAVRKVMSDASGGPRNGCGSSGCR